jgi:hypothetical protein
MYALWWLDPFREAVAVEAMYPLLADARREVA